jgi:hypothetical protein
MREREFIAIMTSLSFSERLCVVAIALHTTVMTLAHCGRIFVIAQYKCNVCYR